MNKKILVPLLKKPCSDGELPFMAAALLALEGGSADKSTHLHILFLTILPMESRLRDGGWMEIANVHALF